MLIESITPAAQPMPGQGGSPLPSPHGSVDGVPTAVQLQLLLCTSSTLVAATNPQMGSLRGLMDKDLARLGDVDVLAIEFPSLAGARIMVQI